MIENIGGIMLKELVKFANHLDSRGFTKEADMVDAIITKAAQDDSGEGLKAVAIRSSKQVLNQFFGIDVFSDVEGNNMKIELSDSNKKKLKNPNMMEAMMEARDSVFGGPSALSVEECSDEGCLPVCFVKTTSKMEDTRYRATVKVKCDEEKSTITLESKVEKI